ncbi:MAG: Rieske (2Fe-2S) protein [Thaumarchaeota archaeon]|nr:Rieske (2Fe-2S) protein [Nitrososphaerota archaeon]
MESSYAPAGQCIPMMEEFERIADVSEIEPGKIRIAKVGGTEIFVANVEGSFFALPNKCTHAGGPLGRGKLTGNVIPCPWHGSKFDVKTGQVVGGPAQKPEIPLEVKVENSSVWVRKP